MRKKKLVALTFDDGPNGKYTTKILDILKKHNIKATFFLVGENVRYYPTITKRIYQEGHIIGNHTYNHVDLTKKSPNQMKNQILKTHNIIKKITDTSPKFFRPPYFKDNKSVRKIAKQLGYKTVSCDIDTFDWHSRGVNIIIKRATKLTKNKSIILFHDGRNVKHNYNRSQTIKALPKIIKKLKNKNFNFVTLKETLKGKKKCLI